MTDNCPSRRCRVCCLLSVPFFCCAAAVCTRTHLRSRCPQRTDTYTTGECFKHMEADSKLIKTSTHRESCAHPIPQEKHLKHIQEHRTARKLPGPSHQLKKLHPQAALYFLSLLHSGKDCSQTSEITKDCFLLPGLTSSMVCLLS